MTKSKWSKVEGRLDLSFESILSRGTGTRNLKREAAFVLKPIAASSSNNARVSSLLKKFHLDGPLTPIAHKYFSTKLGTFRLFYSHATTLMSYYRYGRLFLDAAIRIKNCISFFQTSYADI